MKHPLETTETFIALRASRIAQQLAISKSTAYDWDRKFVAEIAKFRAIEIEAIHERLLGDYETEVSWLASELKRVQEILRKRDYGYENSTALWSYQTSLMKRIDKHRSAITFPDPEPTERDRTNPNDTSPGPGSIEPQTPPPQPPTEQIRTEPNDSAPVLVTPEVTACVESPPAAVGNPNNPPACPDPEPIKRKKHPPYWLNGHYYANPEFPYHVAYAMVFKRGST